VLDIFYPELVEVGDNTLIGYNTVILAHEYLQNEYRTGRVQIGKSVMIGANCTILPGIRIGDGASISAMTLVNCDIPSAKMGREFRREAEVDERKPPQNSFQPPVPPLHSRCISRLLLLCRPASPHSPAPSPYSSRLPRSTSFSLSQYSRSASRVTHIPSWSRSACSSTASGQYSCFSSTVSTGLLRSSG